MEKRQLVKCKCSDTLNPNPQLGAKKKVRFLLNPTLMPETYLPLPSADISARHVPRKSLVMHIICRLVFILQTAWGRGHIPL